VDDNPVGREVKVAAMTDWARSDLLAELAQHIPNKSEHFIREYKARSMRTKQAESDQTGAVPTRLGTPAPNRNNRSLHRLLS